ncbi:MAG: isoprenyl transferase, partial [Candidatus Marinimicrobia bacterium]|nr:isoprenyl transferase [Candidatus Neomarinimicrobiota bacterium]
MSKLLRKQILEQGDMPNHIAIIMDGNGRWASSKNLPRISGHQEGINSVREIVQI